VKVVLATQIKCALASAFVLLVFVSQASAVLRPLFPIKPVAPTNGEVIVIGDELVLRSEKKTSAASPGSATVASCLDSALSLCNEHWSCRRQHFRNDLHAREAAKKDSFAWSLTPRSTTRADLRFTNFEIFLPCRPTFSEGTDK
jgi:hypothetical protein